MEQYKNRYGLVFNFNKDNQLHSLKGPAIEGTSRPNTDAYFVNDKSMTKNEFTKYKLSLLD